jgi:cytochrome P450
MSTAATTEVPLSKLDVISAEHYGTKGYPHEAWARLRAEQPVCFMEPEGYKPFWAITRHADIVEVSKQPHKFKSEGRFILFPEAEAGGTDDFVENPPLRMLVNQDPPEHRTYRGLVSKYFTPRAVDRMEPRLEEITREIFDEMVGEGECEFVNRVAARQPLRMITELLGIPREQEDFVLRITNQNFGLEDPDFQLEGETREERLAFLTEAYGYLMGLVAERRVSPGEDLLTVLAQAKIDGEYVPEFQLFSLAFLVMVAGHDTTRNAISGGLMALLEHPEELEKLRRDHSDAALRTAAEEIVRWTTPVNHFVRTAVEDYELRGQTIRAGDSVALFYASANRDEEVYDDPWSFRIDRTPNPHLGFGIGEHFCLGAHLARMDLRVFFRQFVERFERAELAGPMERLHASFVGGPKRIPLRYTVRAA